MDYQRFHHLRPGVWKDSGIVPFRMAHIPVGQKWNVCKLRYMFSVLAIWYQFKLPTSKSKGKDCRPFLGEKVTLPETSSSPLKIDPWKRRFLLVSPAFSGAFAVSFREGTIFWGSCSTSSLRQDACNGQGLTPLHLSAVHGNLEWWYDRSMFEISCWKFG